MTSIATETHTVVVEREMPHPPEKVWRALTKPLLIEEWLMKKDFKPDQGSPFHSQCRSRVSGRMSSNITGAP